MNQPTLFDLQAFTASPFPIPVSDPHWDEITAPQQVEPEQRWNPSHFGEVPHKVDGDGQLTIFYDDSQEPPDPDDYKNLNDYDQAWDDWKIRVRAQVTASTVLITVETPVRGQVVSDTEKVAPEHNTHWVEKYWVKRSGNKYWYFRYCWMEGRKKNRVHLGSVDSVITKRKKAAVETAIADGKTPQEIKQIIKPTNQETPAPASETSAVHPRRGY
ncbi:hypothetical protein [Nostoc commune]|uniref:hypothetical protein n=1 Tax=Nostoc commune TaxID=1178 RepID=UPI0018C46C44|nr:hypothetical protein [Nostoc commune]